MGKDESAGKDFRRKANPVCNRPKDNGLVPGLTCIQVAAGREVLLSKEDLQQLLLGKEDLKQLLLRKEDLPKSATTPTSSFAQMED